MLFTRRKGYIKARDVLQVESLEDTTKNQIWTVLHENIFRRYSIGGINQYTLGSNLGPFVKAFWIEIAEAPTDTIPVLFRETFDLIRKWFFKSEWFRVFDILELAVKNIPFGIYPQQFQAILNSVLEEENVGYRMINFEIVQITDKTEINEIDEALEKSAGPVQVHLQNALKLLSDRKNPDFRNSIKESISAIEALVKIKLKDDSGTLGNLLPSFKLHPAFTKGLSKIYGYTSDADGIRHALLEEDTLTYNDAKFFLVICSAFINYIESKS